MRPYASRHTTQAEPPANPKSVYPFLQSAGSSVAPGRDESAPLRQPIRLSVYPLSHPLARPSAD